MSNVASLLIAICTLSPSQHECIAIVVQNHSSKTTTRRGILSFSLAFSQALVLTPHHDALADTTTSLDRHPQQQPLVFGSRVQYRPTGEGLQWSPSPPSLQTRLARRLALARIRNCRHSIQSYRRTVVSYSKRKVYPYGIAVTKRISSQSTRTSW